MPFDTTWERRGILTEWWGNATMTEMYQMQERVHGHPDFDDIEYSMHDFTKCVSLSHSGDDAAYAAAIDGAASKSNPTIKIAIVGANANIVAFCNEYIFTKLSPYPVRFFRTMNEAREWVK